ncbi:response regulator [Paenibacillus sp. GCM10027628]|uniref:response regulator n=1 Tax=Paenibacillus sp. GCM10027628 TaxID=3273413 RepID=UPI0036372CD2
MYKALIVDDEKEIREGLRTVFPWHELGIHEIRTADDGDTALELARAWSPHIVISDIKMNRLSGLDFIRQLYMDSSFPGKIVFISGYDEFELVRQAMKQGAVDYLLKPIDIGEMKHIVRKALELIRTEQLRNQNQALLENEAHRALLQMREELMREMAEKAIEPHMETRIIHRLEKLKLDWISKGPLAILAAEVDDLKAIEQEKRYKQERELVLFAIGNVMDQTLQEECPGAYVLFKDKKERWIAAIPCQASDLETVTKLAKLLIARINEFVKVKATIGLNPAPGPFNRLPQLYAGACEALQHKIVLGGNRVWVAGEAADEEAEGVRLGNPDEMIELLKYGTDSDIMETMSGFSDFVRSWCEPHIRDIQQRTFEWLLELFKRAASIGWKDRFWETNPLLIWDEIERFDTLDSLQSRVQAYLLQMSAGIRERLAPQSHIIQEAEAYIRRHYRENLSLQAVAAHVHVTPIWLSKLFKKEMQVTFLEFLTEVRIQKAKEMLGSIQYKIYQISSEVGYRDPVHFSKMFKRYVGYTPKEFRNMQGIDEE